MRRNKALLFCCAVLLVAGMLAGCASAADKPLAGKHFKLAMNATFAPFESVSIKSDGKSEIVGFDVDLLNAMAADLGFTYEIKDMEFKGLIGELHSGLRDLGALPDGGTQEDRGFLDRLLFREDGHHREEGRGPQDGRRPQGQEGGRGIRHGVQ